METQENQLELCNSLITRRAEFRGFCPWVSTKNSESEQTLRI